MANAPKKKRPTKKVSPKDIKDGFRPQSIELDSTEWEEGAFRSRISFARSSGGAEGIKIRTAKKTWGFNEHQWGIWLPKGLDLSAWLRWTILSIKKYSKAFWGTSIDIGILEEEADFYKQQASTLEKELAKTKTKLEDTEELLKIQKEDRERAQQLISKVEEYENELKELIALLDDSKLSDEAKETEVKLKIKNNRWVLGLECEIGAAEKQIDVQTAIDLHVVTDFSEDRIFEFKSPHLSPFKKKGEDTRLYITDALAEAMHQLIIYMRKTNLYSFSTEGGTYGIRGPSGYVVVGYKLDDEQKQAMKDWNFHLRPHIILLTYDDLVRRATIQLENIKHVRKTSTEKASK